MMKFRKRNEDGTFGDFEKIDPNAKEKDEIIADLRAENEKLNMSVIELWEAVIPLLP